MDKRIIEAIKNLKKYVDLNKKDIEYLQEELKKYDVLDALEIISDSVKKLKYYTIENGKWYFNGEDTGIVAVGKDGVPGKDGKDGKDGAQGKEGKRGPQGLPGKEGKRGPQGLPGKDGKDGKDGVQGKPGKDGETPILKIGKLEQSPEYGGAKANIRKGKDNIFYLDLTLPRGPQGFQGFDGKDAKINGHNVLTLEAGKNITFDEEGDTITINAKGGGGGGGTSDYEDLDNLPQINNVELIGNKSLSDLGIQPEGDYALSTDIPTNVSDLTNDAGYITGYTETDPIFTASAASNITSSDISNWNGKADANDIPTKVSDLTNDAGYITGYTETDPIFSASPSAGITSSDIDNWDAKQEALVSGTNIKTINNLSLLGSGNIDIQGGGGGTSDYDQLSNRPQINSVTLTGNKSLNDLGIQPAGNYLTSESDPVFTASAAYGISSSDITNWNNKSDFSGSYNDLTDTPTIPDELSDLSDDSTHRLVTDSDKTTWNGKYSLPSGGIPKTDLASGVQTSLGLADSALQSISSSDVTTALGYTPYDSTNPNGYTSNVGTITGITMNGTSKGTSGVVDLGTVITSHQDISGKLDISKVKNEQSTTAGDVYDVRYINTMLDKKSNDFSNLLSDYYISNSYFSVRKRQYPTDPSNAIQGACMIDNPNTASGAPERVMLVYKVQTTGTDVNKAGVFYIYDPKSKTIIEEVSVTGNTIDVANYYNFNNGVTLYETGDMVYYDHVNSLAFNPNTKKCLAFAYFYSGKNRYTSESSYGSRFYEFNITYSNGHYNFEIERVVDTKGTVSSCAYNDKRDLYILCSTGGMWMELKPDFSEITEVDKRNDLNPFWSKAQATARGLTKRTLTQGITYYNGYYYWGLGMTPLTETKALESFIYVLDENYEVVKNIKVLDGTELEQVCFGDSLRETYLVFNGSACKIRHGSIYMGDQETMPNLYNENFIISRNGDGSVLNNATSEECSTGIFYIDLLAGATISNGEVTEYQNVWCDGTSTNPYNDFNMIYELISSSYNRIRIYLANTTTSNILKLNGIQKWIHIIGQGSNDIYPKLGRLNVCNCQNVRIERLDIENNGTVTSKAVTISGSNVIINDCYIKSTGYNYYIQANSSVYSQSTIRTYGLKLEHTGTNTETFIFVATGSKAFFVPSSAQFIESGSTSAESYVTCTGGNCSGNSAFINVITGHIKTRNNIDINDVNRLNTPV